MNVSDVCDILFGHIMVTSYWFIVCFFSCCFFFFKQKTAYEMRISDWSSDVCSSDLVLHRIDVGVRRRSAGGDRILPDQVFGGHFGPEVTDLRPHVAVRQLEPGAGTGVLERFMVAPELLADLAKFGKIGRASCRERVCQYV